MGFFDFYGATGRTARGNSGLSDTGASHRAILRDLHHREYASGSLYLPFCQKGAVMGRG